MKFVERIPNTLRWILALPIALLFSYCVRYVSIVSLQLFLGHKLDGTEIVYLSIDNILGIAVMISMVYIIVPKHKFISCLILSIIYGIFLSIASGFFFVESTYNDATLEMPLWKYIYSLAVSIITIIYSCVAIYNHEKYEEG